VRFLGPTLAHVGVPLTLAWQIMRMAQPELKPSSDSEKRQVTEEEGSQGQSGGGTSQELLAYDIVQPREAESALTHQQAAHPHRQLWTLAANGRGVVRLGTQPGAAAVLEVETAATESGVFLPPCLRFQGARASNAADPWQPSSVTVINA
jgi:hypothetical protein